LTAYGVVSGRIGQRRREKENAHKREMEKGAVVACLSARPGTRYLYDRADAIGTSTL